MPNGNTDTTRRRLMQLLDVIGSSGQDHTDTERKIGILQGLPTTDFGPLGLFLSSSDATSQDYDSISLGNVTIKISRADGEDQSLIPLAPLPSPDTDQTTYRHLEWMMQKVQLSQDMFLLGPPTPHRLALTLQLASLLHRPIEYMPLSADTSEADMKQRRDVSAGTLRYIDQACVRAAKYGRILILDGIERVERNVLPLMNNLLENREMPLDDGHLLVHPQRYDTLASTSSLPPHFIRVSDHFLVIALGLPVPPNEGYPLDPPLRSRFQARYIPDDDFSTRISRLTAIAPLHPPKQVEMIIAFHELLSRECRGGVASGDLFGDQDQEDDDEERSARTLDVTIPPPFGDLEALMAILNAFPSLPLPYAYSLIYPFTRMPSTDPALISLLHSLWSSLLSGPSSAIAQDNPYVLESLEEGEGGDGLSASPSPVSLVRGIQYRKISWSGSDIPGTSRIVSCGPGSRQAAPTTDFVLLPSTSSTLSAMLMAHAHGDFCLIGAQGTGKSALFRHFASILGYHPEYMSLHEDISSRDILQTRGTNAEGDTIWRDSPLVRAARLGHVIALDGLEHLRFGTLLTLKRMIRDREVQLPDTSRLIHPARWAWLKGTSKNGSSSPLSDYMPIHPNFRIVGLAREASSGSQGISWVRNEVLSLWLWIPLSPLPLDEEKELLRTSSPGVPEDALQDLLEFTEALRNSTDELLSPLASSLSTRQLLRIAKRLSRFPGQEGMLRASLHRALLSRFLPRSSLSALEALMDKCIRVISHTSITNGNLPDYAITMDSQTLQIGDLTQSRPTLSDPNEAALIPSVRFHDNPQHTRILHDLLMEYQLDEHILLMGNQGVGKNKLVDRLLELMGRPCEYIQLHRDTTIQSLTLIPSIEAGVVSYKDSPLISAALHGRILVVDEADKAPTHVIATLKTLAQDGWMSLSDGRFLTTSPSDPQSIPIHKNFRIFMLANRPGFPFMGNNFYREIGDTFSCLVIDNPDIASEIMILRQYAPSIEPWILERLAVAFAELRSLVDNGLLLYPYSTRELVQVVRHMEAYNGRGSGVADALRNVVDFEFEDPDTLLRLTAVFEKHGISLKDASVPIHRERTVAKVEMGSIAPITTVPSHESWVPLPNPGVKEIQSKEAQVKGGWELTTVGKVGRIRLTPGQVRSFSPIQRSFRLPFMPGSAHDLILSRDPNSVVNTFYAVSGAPVLLYRIIGSGPESHRQGLAWELHEYFPAPSYDSLNLLEVIVNGDDVEGKGSALGAWIVVWGTADASGPTKPSFSGIPASHSVSLLDVTKAEAHILTLSGLERTRPFHIARSPLDERFGVLSFQIGTKSIVWVDVGGKRPWTQYVIQVAHPVDYIMGASPGEWFVQYADGHCGLLIIHRNPHSGGIDIQTPMWRVEMTTGLPLGKVMHAATHASSVHGMLIQRNDSASANTVSVVQGSASPGAGSITTLSWEGLSTSIDSRVENAILTADSGAGIITTVDLRADTVTRVNLEDMMAWTVPLGTTLSSTSSVISLASDTEGTTWLLQKDGTITEWYLIHERVMSTFAQWKALNETGGTRGERLSLSIHSGSGSEGGSGNSGGGGGGGGFVEEEDGDFEKGQQREGKDLTIKHLENGRKANDVDVDKLELRGPDALPKRISDAQRKFHEESMKTRLRSLKMSPEEAESYRERLNGAQREIRELRLILESVEAVRKERAWLRGQTSGEMDDTRLVDGIAGEKNVFKRRGEDTLMANSPLSSRPKRLHFVFDVSASMFRFNKHDHRLDRSLETALMLMEALKGLDGQFIYSIGGHSGDGANIPFVEEGKSPKTVKEIMSVLDAMQKHTQFCLSGDNTVEAIKEGIHLVTSGTDAMRDYDDRMVVILSDANLGQYSIKPQVIGSALRSNAQVYSCIIFIGSIKGQAEKFQEMVGGGAYICLDTRELPLIIKSIFTSSIERVIR